MRALEIRIGNSGFIACNIFIVLGYEDKGSRSQL